MAGSRPQSHGDAISMENSLKLSTTLVCLYQMQQQQEQLLQQQQQQLQINQQPEQRYLNENQNCDNEGLNETNSKPPFFSFVASQAFFGDKLVQVKLINFISTNKLVL